MALRGSDHPPGGGLVIAVADDEVVAGARQVRDRCGTDPSSAASDNGDPTICERHGDILHAQPLAEAVRGGCLFGLTREESHAARITLRPACSLSVRWRHAEEGS